MCLFPFQSINIYDRFIDTVKLAIRFKQDYLKTGGFNLLKQWVSFKIKIDLKYRVRIGSKLLMMEV